MFQWVANIYARRIVNVNVNIVLAGVLALPVVLGILKLAEHFGLTAAHKALVPAITFVADIIADVLIYFALHWLANHSPWRKKELHDVAKAADHLRLFDPEAAKAVARANAELDQGEEKAAVEKEAHGASGGVVGEMVGRSAELVRFIKDAMVVQVERAALSPLLYVLWLGTQYLMLHRGYSTIVATATGFVIAVAVTRTIHTIWMLAKERRRSQEMLAAVAAKEQIKAATVQANGLPPSERPAVQPAARAAERELTTPGT